MRLKSLIKNVGISQVSGSIEDIDVRDLCENSKDVRRGVLFVAVRGSSQDGHRYIADAVRRNACAIVLDDVAYLHKRSTPAPFILVKDSKVALGELADVFLDFPYRRIKLVGITGTNGKTTVSYLIKSLLTYSSKKCGVVGTIGYRVDGENKPLGNTTPGPLELRRLIKKMADAGNDYVALEVSSHALDQERVAGMIFEAAIFTNLTQDHLDYHHTMEEYFLAKRKLFCDYVAEGSSLIVNSDDTFGLRLIRSLGPHVLRYGFGSDADVRAIRYELNTDSSRVQLSTPKGPLEITTRLIGRHNLSNIMAAVALGITQGLSLEDIRKGIEELAFVPGRLDRIDSERGYTVFVDYAHTDDALKNVLESLRAILHNGRIITVFGCGGDRDKLKRPQMGRVVSSLSDHCIVTSDNPRSEEPQAIIDHIVQGMTNKNYEVEPDRWTAIRKALMLAQKNDIVLVAGKGHETSQIVKGEILPFDDKTVVHAIMAQLEKNV